jgi:signal transduction histidine kinase
LAAAFLATGIIFMRSSSGSAPGNLSSYAYEDTRQLVALVEEAAMVMEQKGESAFSEFGRKGSKWFSGPYYLFIYEPDGTCVFHPLQPDWVGKNMSDLRDMNGKPMVQLVAQVGTSPEKDASDWIFYLWPDKTQLIPQWKSAYVRKVIAPSGKTYVIGSGVYDIKMERVFVEERVRMACDLLESQGKEAAFRQLRDPASPFVFLGTFVFVLDTAGHVMVDPAFPTQSGRDLSQFEDAVGRRPVQQILEKLKNAEEAWVQYLWPKPGASLPSRKLVYVRKAHAGDETFIVGSDFFLATPIWMKD